MFQVSQIMCKVSGVRCLMTHVACHLLSVTCHMSLTLTAKATYPPPANSPIMHCRLFHKDPKKIIKPKNVMRYVNISDTVCDQKYPVHSFRNGTNTHTTERHTNFETESAQWGNSAKIYMTSLTSI